MKTQQLIQTYLDKSVPYRRERWMLFALLLLVFIIRIITKGAYHLVTYCLFLYLLHGFIGFCTPIDSDIPDPFDIEETDNVYLPEEPLPRSADESKPFMRRLPEFQYWFVATKATVSALAATTIPPLNLPVYSPILVGYFLVLVVMTTLKIRKHMKKFRYNPFVNAKKMYRAVMEK